MPFPTNVKTNLLVQAGRRCCLCWEFCGVKIEVHHIIPESEGGSDDEGNGMPLCFDCHADVHAYDDRHPKGTKFRPEELRQHRDRLFRWIKQGGPLVFDRLAGEAVTVNSEALLREEPPPVGAPVDLKHDAKIARYLRYIRQAEQLKDRGQFHEAIRSFESAFRLAESDADLTAYSQGGNYHLRQLLLWECHLESGAQGGARENLRAAFNRGVDENAIRQVFFRERLPGGLRCRDYFYLLFQESLFLFDEEMGHRRPPQERLARIGDLMDLIENPHCPDRTDELLERARGIERNVITQLASRFPAERYSRIT